jgi:hypothetical protein
VRRHDPRTIALSGTPTPSSRPTAILGRLVAPLRLVRVGLAAASLALVPACGVSGLSFVQDDRVDIVRPEDRSTVDLPLRIDWSVEDFAVGRGKGSFGVFVDRTPQPSGKTQAWLFRGDPSCRGTGARLCSTAAFLGQRNVFRTTRSDFTIEQVNRLSGAQAGRQFHEATIVLLDEDGERVGEGAWSVQFEVDGED